jgi:hypothetical protein
MTFLVFNNQNQANTAITKINDNFVETLEITEVDVNGHIIGRNAQYGNLRPSKQKTETWGIPEEYTEGWVILKPPTDALGMERFRTKNMSDKNMIRGIPAHTEMETVTPL